MAWKKNVPPNSERESILLLTGWTRREEFVKRGIPLVARWSPPGKWSVSYSLAQAWRLHQRALDRHNYENLINTPNDSDDKTKA